MSSVEQAVSSKQKVHQNSNHLSNGGMLRWAAVTLCAAASVFAAGCGAARPSKYYQLALPSNLSSAKANDPLSVTLLIGRLKASHLYREDRIVYSGKGEEMGTYEYQRWTEPPTEMIEEMLLRELRATSRYQGVYSLGSETRGDFLLQGRLFDFKEISDGTLLARLTLDLELRDMKTGTAVWTHSYAHDEPVNTKDISAVVAALSRNAQQGVSEVRSSLDEFFASHPVK
jgi:ABC-type uncharacterized transport system auxiliary subunit